MTPKEKYRELVARLYQRTAERKIKWETRDHLGVYTLVGERVINLASGKNSDGDPLENLTIRNSEGKVLEQFNDEAILGAEPNIEGFDSWWQLMVQVREMATRQASGADEAIDDILKHLDDNSLS